MKKKVLLVITKSNFGGAQRYVYDLAVALPREEYSVKVAFGGSGTLQKKLTSKHITAIPIPGLTRDVGVLRELRSFFSLIKIFKIERPDIVHLNSSKAGGLGALAARLAGVNNIIFTAHGWAFNEDRIITTKVLLYILHYITVLLSHKTIAVSEDIKRQIVFLPFVKNKIAVIKNGIEPVTLISKEIAQETLKNLNPHLNRIDTNGKIWIGTISELHTTKGLIYAIGAIKRVVEHHPNIVFLIIGEGELRHKLEALIHTAGLDETVFLLGYVDNAPTLLSAFDIFTLSSISEALSYTILEAGHAGLPIVASRVGGIPEIITHQEVGMLVEAKNSDAITQALEELIEKPQQRERMGSLLKKRVDGTFTKEQMLKKTMELYQT